MKEKLRLIPFDGRSDAHAERMCHQRVACGWGKEDVETWRGDCDAGRKGVWWLVLEEEIGEREKMMREHLSRYPAEAEPLRDTSTSVFKQLRTPTDEAFVPVGHVGLEWKTAPADVLGRLPAEGVIWATTFYISHPLQGYGLGRSAMRQVEGVAAREPLRARVVALDTMKGAFQLREEGVGLLYKSRGLPMPSVMKSNEEWYRRQGYRVIGEEEKGYLWLDPNSGGDLLVPRVFLMKELGVAMRT